MLSVKTFKTNGPEMYTILGQLRCGLLPKGNVRLLSLSSSVTLASDPNKWTRILLLYHGKFKFWYCRAQGTKLAVANVQNYATGLRLFAPKILDL